MTVEQLDPSISHSNQSQTTMLDTPGKMIEKQHPAIVAENLSRFTSISL
jgi:hypothetical protein